MFEFSNKPRWRQQQQYAEPEWQGFRWEMPRAQHPYAHHPQRSLQEEEGEGSVTWFGSEIVEQSTRPGERRRVNTGSQQRLGTLLQTFLGTAQGEQYVLDDFDNFKKLGSGSFGTTYSVHDKRNNRTLVLKQMSKKKVTPEMYAREVKILERVEEVCERHLLCFVGNFEDDFDYYIVTEYLQSYIPMDTWIEEQLQDETSTFSRERATTLICNLGHGLQQIHATGVAHMDIKPGNIMIEPNTLAIKFIDFGISCMTAVCKWGGSPGYMAAELLDSKKKWTLDEMKLSDLWALGMVLFDVFTGGLNLYDALVQLQLFRTKQGVPDPRFGKEGIVMQAIASGKVNPQLFARLFIEYAVLLPEDFAPVVAERVILPLLQPEPTERQFPDPEFCLGYDEEEQ